MNLKIFFFHLNFVVYVQSSQFLKYIFIAFIITKPNSILHGHIFYYPLFTFQLQYPETNTEEEIRSRTKIVDGLKTALRTSTHSFVIKFIELDGLLAILDCLERMDYFTAQTSIHTSLIGCLKALMNNSVSN